MCCAACSTIIVHKLQAQQCGITTMNYKVYWSAGDACSAVIPVWQAFKALLHILQRDACVRHTDAIMMSLRLNKHQKHCSVSHDVACASATLPLRLYPDKHKIHCSISHTTLHRVSCLSMPPTVLGKQYTNAGTWPERVCSLTISFSTTLAYILIC